MFKKLLSGSMILISSAAVAGLNAPSWYVGPSIFLKANTTTSGNTREASPKVSFGYGGIMGQGFYLGGEAYLMPGSMQINSKNTPGVPSLKTSYSFGLSAIPGLTINDGTMVFLRLGIVESHFSAQNKSISGLQTGVGIQSRLTASWDLRAEYVYSAYRSLTGTGSPRSDWFGVGGVYNF